MDGLSRKKAKRASTDVGIRNANYQNLLNKYLELQKECVSRKEKRRTALLKRDILLGEVRFLRKRRKSLLKSQAPIAYQQIASSPLDPNCSFAGKQGIEMAGALHTRSVAAKTGKKTKNHQHGIGKQSKCWNGEGAPLKDYHGLISGRSEDEECIQHLNLTFAIKFLRMI